VKALSINFTNTQAQKLEETAITLGVSKSALVREALNGIDFLAVGRCRLNELEASSAHSKSKPARRRILSNSERALNGSRTRNLTHRTST
jgi:hypothetical protein